MRVCVRLDCFVYCILHRSSTLNDTHASSRRRLWWMFVGFRIVSSWWRSIFTNDERWSNEKNENYVTVSWQECHDVDTKPFLWEKFSLRPFINSFHTHSLVLFHKVLLYFSSFFSLSLSLPPFLFLSLYALALVCFHPPRLSISPPSPFHSPSPSIPFDISTAIVRAEMFVRIDMMQMNKSVSSVNAKKWKIALSVFIH